MDWKKNAECFTVFLKKRTTFIFANLSSQCMNFPEDLRTYRLFPRTVHGYLSVDARVVAAYAEVLYAVAPRFFGKEREAAYITAFDCFAKLSKDIEYRLYWPGPKLWVDTHTFSVENFVDKKKISAAKKKNAIIEFRVSLNGGPKESVPLIYENICSVLDELQVPSLFSEKISKRVRASIKDFAKARKDYLNPILKNGIKESFRKDFGKADSNKSLLDLMVEFNKTVNRF